MENLHNGDNLQHLELGIFSGFNVHKHHETQSSLAAQKSYLVMGGESFREQEVPKTQTVLITMFTQYVSLNHKTSKWLSQSANGCQFDSTNTATV